MTKEETSKEKPCNHFMVWNIQGGYSYYSCDRCNYIDGKKTFEAQKQDLLKKIEGAKNQFKDGYYAFHFTYTSNTGKRIAEINRVNEPLPPDMAYQLAKKHISEFPESVMDWFVENRGIIHILEDIKQSLK